MEYKIDQAVHPRASCAFEIKSIDEDGTFGGYASVFHVVDSHQDVVKPGAFQQSLKSRVTPVWLLWQHQWDSPIGVIQSLFEDRRGLFIKGKLLMEVAQAREAYQLLKSGVVKGLSIGYSVKSAVKNPLTGIRALHALDLWEISLVTFPANEAAQVTVVKSARSHAPRPKDMPAVAHLMRAIDRAGSALLS